MDIYSLLDKNDQVELKIFNELLKGDMHHEIAVIRKNLGLTRPRFNDRLAGLSQRLMAISEQITLDKVNGEEVVLRLPLYFNTSDVYFIYLKESINYQILYRLYERGKLDLFTVIEELFLSESAYYRRIREINEVLIEFDLKIVNGILKGDELQIRYFFFNLFWYFFPLTIVVENNTDPTIKNLITIIENQTELKFSFFDYQKLFLWLKITLKRINHPEKQPSSVVEYHLMVLRERESYRQTKNIYFRFLARLALPFQDEEVLYVYLFLLSQFILPIKADFFADVFTVVSPKVKPVLTEMEDYLYSIFNRAALDEEVKEKVRYTLINIIYTEIFFTGFSVYFDEEKLQDVGQEIVSLPFDEYVDKLYELLQNIYRHVKKQRRILKQAEMKKNQALIFRLLCLLSYVDKISTPRFLIGFDYYGDDLLKELSYEVSVDLLKQDPLIIAEPYNSTTDYDLVLTNSDVNKQSYLAPTYVFSEVLTPKEVRYLRKIIKKMHLKKVQTVRS